MPKVIGTCLRAIYAGIVAGLSGLVTVLVGDADFGDLTAGQIVTILLAVVIGFGGVWGISNRPG